MNGLPSENIDELDRRLKIVEEFIASKQKPAEPERTEPIVPKPVHVFVDSAKGTEEITHGEE